MRLQPFSMTCSFLFGLILLLSLGITAFGSSDSSGLAAVANPVTPHTQLTGTQTYSFGGKGQVIASENFRMQVSTDDTIAEKCCRSESFRLYHGDTHALSRQSSH